MYGFASDELVYTVNFYIQCITYDDNQRSLAYIRCLKAIRYLPVEICNTFRQSSLPSVFGKQQDDNEDGKTFVPPLAYSLVGITKICAFFMISHLKVDGNEKLGVELL